MAGTIALSDQRREGVIRWARILATADASDGSFPTKTLRELGIFVDGSLLAVQTNPGSTAPTALYDITLVDSDGVDRLGGVGADRSASSSERVSVGGAPYVAPDEELTLTITGNSVNSATVEILLFHSSLIVGSGAIVEALNAVADGVTEYAEGGTIVSGDTGTLLFGVDNNGKARVLPSGLSTVRVTGTPTVDTSIFGPGDILHGTIITLADVVRYNGGSGTITKQLIIDKSTQTATGEVWYFTAAPTLPSANAAFSISDADMLAYLVGVLPWGAPYSATAGQVYQNKDDRLSFTCASDSKNLYAALMVRSGTPTYGASDLTLLLNVARD